MGRFRLWCLLLRGQPDSRRYVPAQPIGSQSARHNCGEKDDPGESERRKVHDDYGLKPRQDFANGALGCFLLEAKRSGKRQAAKLETVGGQAQSHRAGFHLPFLLGMISERTLSDHSTQASFAPGMPKEVTTGPTGPPFQRGSPTLSMTRTPGALLYLPRNVSQ